MRRAADLTGIALHAIWANKLRSSLTILGNIVAVGSIIAVVSLIQGVNAEVRNAIVSQFGPDSFGIDRTPVVLTEADIEAVRNNPRVSLDDADAIRRFSPSVRAVMAQSGRSGEVRYRDRVLENVSIRGVTRDYGQFPIFTAERGRLFSRTEVARNRGVALLGAEAADRLFDQLDPIDRRIKIQGVNFRVVGVSEPTSLRRIPGHGEGAGRTQGATGVGLGRRRRPLARTAAQSAAPSNPACPGPRSPAVRRSRRREPGPTGDSTSAGANTPQDPRNRNRASPIVLVQPRRPRTARTKRSDWTCRFPDENLPAVDPARRYGLRRRAARLLMEAINELPPPEMFRLRSGSLSPHSGCLGTSSTSTRSGNANTALVR